MIFSPVDPGGSQVEEHTIYETLATNISQNKEKKGLQYENVPQNMGCLSLYYIPLYIYTYLFSS